MATPLNALKKVGFTRIELFIDKVIGNGAFGAVCHAQCDDLPCAAKILHPAIFVMAGQHPFNFVARFEQECEIMCAVQHPNIIQYFGVHHDNNTGKSSLLMELMDENLTHYLECLPYKIPYHLQVNFCRDIVQALSFLHSNDIVHRNLSGNNVLLIGNVRAKVSDFGMAKLSSVEDIMSPATYPYMPPDPFKNGPIKYGKKIDCFSFGVIAVQIMTQKLPDPTDHRKPLGSENSMACKIVPEIERRENHISMIDPTHPLLPVALLCLNDYSTHRPSAQMLCMEMKKLQESDEYCESLSNKGDNQTKMRDTDINASILEQTRMKKLLDEPRLEEGTSVAIEVYPAEKKPSAEHAVTSKLADMQESECDNFSYGTTEAKKQE